jgi:hypothetical protein
MIRDAVRLLAYDAERLALLIERRRPVPASPSPICDFTRLKLGERPPNFSVRSTALVTASESPS